MKSKLIINIRNNIFKLLFYGIMGVLWVIMSICLLIPRAIFWWIFSDDSFIDNIKLSYERFPES